MLGDPHFRSAHRAGPAGGLAMLSPQALVRQAQAGQARARQAIIRQAIARRTQTRARPAPAHPTPAHPTPAHPTPAHPASADPTSAHPTSAHRASADPASAHRGPSRWGAGDTGSARGLDRTGSGAARPAEADVRPGEVDVRPGEADARPLTGGRPAEVPGGRGWRLVGEHTTGRLTAVWRAAAMQAAARLAPDRVVPDPALLDPPHLHPVLVDPSGPKPALHVLAPGFGVPHRVVPGRRAAPHRRQPRDGGSSAGRRWTGLPDAGGSGRQRHTLRRRAPWEPQQTLQLFLSGLGGLIVLAIVALSAFFVIAEERRGPERQTAQPAGSVPAIASRQVDSAPLTLGEVFPGSAVQPVTGAAGYAVTMVHSDSECRVATIGELGALLDDHGCNQVVRARLTAPYGGYQVTAGIFNLADEDGAGRVGELAGTLVEDGRGTFATLGGSVGDPLTEPLAQVGWHSRGHYVLYCVVARPDGQLVTDDDLYAARITAELVERYLDGRVVGGRVAGRRTSDP